MSPLFESVALKYGKAQNLEYHQRRMNFSAEALWQDNAPNIEHYFDTNIPSKWNNIPLAKAKYIYDASGFIELKIEEYEKREINELIVVETPEGCTYPYKFADREWINELKSGLSADQEILLHREGVVRDTSFTNVAFLKSGVWYTPAKPLLIGTCLMKCIDRGLLVPADIRINELKNYEKIKLFNALMCWEDNIILDIKKVSFSANSCDKFP